MSLTWPAKQASNLVSLQKLRNVIKDNLSISVISKITEIGYSKVKHKKYYVIYDNKKINFGSSSNKDFLIYGDNELGRKRRKLYRERHKNDNIDDPYSPGYWSWYVLWT